MSNYFTQQALLQRFSQCTYRKKLLSYNMHGGAYNSLCGDVVNIMAYVEKNQIHEIAFQAEGCIISQVATSVLCEKSHHLALEQASLLTVQEITQTLGLTLGPTRMKCAMLGLQALTLAHEKYKNAQSNRINRTNQYSC